jgi:hypothetical protein
LALSSEVKWSNSWYPSSNSMDWSRCKRGNSYCRGTQSISSRHYWGGAENHYADKTNWQNVNEWYRSGWFSNRAL